MNAASTAPLNAAVELVAVVAIHRRMHAHSNSYLVTASDGAMYVLKVFPAAMARTLSFREVLSTNLGNKLGLSMARWAMLQLDDTVCQQYRQSSSGDDGIHVPLSGGIYFGSRMATDTGHFVEYLPAAIVQTNPKIARQIGCMRILDLWLAHRGPRQYIARLDELRPVHIYFFGHSGVLEVRKLPALAAEAPYAYRAACKVAGGAQPIDDWIVLLSRATDNVFQDAVRSVPGLWRDLLHERRTLEFLLARRNELCAIWRIGFNANLESQAFPSRSCATLLV